MKMVSLKLLISYTLPLWWLLVFMSLMLSAEGYVMTENQIKEDIKFLSQTADGVKPSRLRALLLADLKRALPSLLLPEAANNNNNVNCTSEADLKVTPRCTCDDYSSRLCSSATTASPSSMLSAMMLSNYGKRSRIQRSCEDYCCRRVASAGRQSINEAATEYDDAATAAAAASAAATRARCELHKSEIDSFGLDTKTNISTSMMKLMSSVVQIFSTKSKSPLCLGTLIHPQIVLTTMVCASMQINDRFRIKVRETVDRYQYRYQVRNVTKRIIPDNYAELFQKFGFNIALLVLNKNIEMNSQTRATCLAQSAFSAMSQKPLPTRCFVEALENKNGRVIERREDVNIYSTDRCQLSYKEQKRSTMFFPKSNICAAGPDELDIEISLNGAPLICVYPTQHGFRYVQHGLLSWSTVINQSPHLFANISNYKSWIDKQLTLLGLDM